MLNACMQQNRKKQILHQIMALLLFTPNTPLFFLPRLTIDQQYISENLNHQKNNA